MQLTQRRHVRLGVLAALAALGLTLAACTGPTLDGGSSGAADTNVVKIDMPTNVTSIDPINNPFLVDNEIVGLTSASLFQFSKGSATQTEPVLAAGIEVSDDLLTHAVTLKDGLTFSDGSPLTADEVAASLTRLRDTPGPNQTEAASFADIAATDATTVTITLSIPNADLTQTLALPSTGIVAPGAIDDDAYFEGGPVFSGAYIPDGDVTGNAYALVRNENFGGTIPVIERLEFSVVADAVTTATRLQGGDIDFAPSLPIESVSQISGDLTARTVDRVASMFLIPNNREGSLFSDVRLRQALAWAIDRQALTTVVYGEDATVQSGPYPVPADYPMPVDVYPAQDVDKAKELLVGTACEDGCSFTASFFATAAQQEGRAAVALQQMLEPLGMTVQAQPVEAQQFIQNSLDGAFDLNVVESGGFNVPSSFAGAFETEFTQCIYSGCSNPAMQPAIDALFAAPDEATQEEASVAILDIFNEWTPIVPVAGAATTYGTRSDLVDTIVLQPNALFWIAGE